MKNGWEWDGPLTEAWSHLASAVLMLDADSGPMLSTRVRNAYELLDAARLAAIKEECEHA